MYRNVYTKGICLKLFKESLFTDLLESCLIYKVQSHIEISKT